MLSPFECSMDQVLAYLGQQEHIAFSVRGRLDGNRYLPRQFPATFPILVQLHRYPGYQQMVGERWLHWHDYYELVLIVSGSGVYQCGTERFEFHAGDILMVDALKLHGVWDVTKEHTALCIFFHSHAVAPAGLWMERGFLSAFNDRSPGVQPKIKAPAVNADVWNTFGKMAAKWFGETSDNRDLLGLKLSFLNLLYALRSNVEIHDTFIDEPPEIRASRENQMRVILDYIAQHSHEKLPQSEVAKIAGMSTSRFRAFFKATTGWGYAEYLLDVRTEHAARLLKDTARSVADIALATGFSDQSHLQRAFKSRHGVSPLAFRKNHMGETPRSE